MAQLIAARGQMSIGELIEHFGVSGPTARRDVEVLSRAGLATRIHGGVLAPGRGGAAEPLFLEKLRVNQGAKGRIGAAAAAHVADGQTVLIDSGTTALAAARALAGRPVHVIACDVKVAEAAASGRTRVTLPGGDVRNGYFSLVGEWALAFLADRGCDLFLMGADAIDVDGISNSTLEEADVKRAAIRCARKTVVMADHSKLDGRAAVPVCSLEMADVLVTDRKAAALLQPYRSRIRTVELR